MLFEISATYVIPSAKIFLCMQDPYFHFRQEQIFVNKHDYQEQVTFLCKQKLTWGCTEAAENILSGSPYAFSYKLSLGLL